MAQRVVQKMWELYLLVNMCLVGTFCVLLGAKAVTWRNRVSLETSDDSKAAGPNPNRGSIR